MLEKQFISFLMERIDVKLGEIKKATEGETVHLVADETQIFVDQLKDVLTTLYNVEPKAPEPQPVRRGRRNNDENV